MDPRQTTGSVPDQSVRKLKRQGRDLEAQLGYARQEQGRIRRKLQRQLLTNTENQRGLEARLVSALAELNDTRVERDQIRQDLFSAMEARTRMEKDHQDRLAKEDRRRLKLESELKGVYTSLSWRLTAPLRWLNVRFTRRKPR